MASPVENAVIQVGAWSSVTEQRVLSRLKTSNEEVTLKKAYRIKLKGQYVITPKGKTVWYGMGPTKNALRRLVTDAVRSEVSQRQGYNWKFVKEMTNYCLQLWFANGTIEIEEQTGVQ